MATIPISTGNTTGQLFQGGRRDSQTASFAPTYLSYSAVINGGDIYQFQFPTGATSGLTFGTPLSMFVDNSSSTFEMSCTVVNTGQTFIIPARTSGVYGLDAVAGSTIEVVSSGTSGGKVNFTFYNYNKPPVVWYAYGSNVEVTSIPNGSDVALGDTADAVATIPANPNTLISLTKGIFNTLLNGALLVQGYDGAARRSLLTDSSGRLLVVGSAAGNAVYGPDATGVAPTQPPVFIAGLDSGGFVRPLNVDPTGDLNVSVVGTAAATQSGVWNITNVSGTISLPTGAATQATLALLPVAQGSTTAGQSGPLIQGAVLTADPARTTGQTSPLSLTTTGRLRVDSSPKGNATSAVTSVAASATNVTITALNTARVMATVFNESASATLYLKLGATASVTSYTTQILPGGYYEVPATYTGIIDGIWSAAVGNARVTVIS